jgi:hypothetical protein
MFLLSFIKYYFFYHLFFIKIKILAKREREVTIKFLIARTTVSGSYFGKTVTAKVNRALFLYSELGVLALTNIVL